MGRDVSPRLYPGTTKNENVSYSLLGRSSPLGLARSERFELPTPRFEVCSHLFSAVSYHAKLHDGRPRSALFC
jgi:hypothetical protein